MLLLETRQQLYHHLALVAPYTKKVCTWSHGITSVLFIEYCTTQYKLSNSIYQLCKIQQCTCTSARFLTVATGILTLIFIWKSTRKLQVLYIHQQLLLIQCIYYNTFGTFQLSVLAHVSAVDQGCPLSRLPLYKQHA